MAQIVRQYKHRHTSNTKQNKKKNSVAHRRFSGPRASFITLSSVWNGKKKQKQKLNIHTFTCKYCLCPRIMRVGTYDWQYSGRHYIINSSQSQGFL